jgi:tetratricopeptide (TPR) repeat protein
MRFQKVKIKNIFILCLGLMALFSVSSAWGEMKTFTEEYAHTAGKLDNKASARVRAVEDTKDRLWRDMYTYLAALGVMKQLQFKDVQMAAFVPVLATIRIVNETWNGKVYWVKADFSADADEIQRILRQLAKDETRQKDLTDNRNMREEARRKIVVLEQAVSYTPGRARKVEVTKYRSLLMRLSFSNLLLKGYIAESSGRWAEAKKAYDAALKFDVGNDTTLYHRGVASYSLGKNNEAIRDFTSVVKRNPKNAAAYYLRGIAYAHAGKNKRAVDDFSSAIEIDDRLGLAHYQRAIALDRTGKGAAAIRDLTRAIELNPEDSQA